MATNDIQAFATGPGSNVITQANYLALSALGTGFVAGTALSAQVNKVLRQSSFVSAALAQLIVDQTGANVTDDGNVAGLEAKLLSLFLTFGRTRLKGNVTLYQNSTGSDTLNTGLSPSSPFATIQAAVNYIFNMFDLNGYTVTIQLAGGQTITAPTVVSGNPVGFNGKNPITIVSAGTTIVSVTGVYAFTANYGGSLQIGAGVSLSGTGGAYQVCGALNAALGGFIYFGGCTFLDQAGQGCHLNADQGGIVYASSSYTVAGGAYNHVLVSVGQAFIANVNVNFTGTPAFVNSFADVQNGGVLNASASSFSGTGATGPRYGVISNGIILTGGSGANYLPGNSAGATSTGGLYL